MPRYRIIERSSRETIGRYETVEELMASLVSSLRRREREREDLYVLEFDEDGRQVGRAVPATGLDLSAWTTP